MVNAATWDERARIMRAGKSAYLKEQSNTQAKAAIIEEYYKSQIMERALTGKRPGLSMDGGTVVMR
jgi:hypothetical protein